MKRELVSSGGIKKLILKDYESYLLSWNFNTVFTSDKYIYQYANVQRAFLLCGNIRVYVQLHYLEVT